MGGRVGDEVADRRRRRFVGRSAELSLFGSAVDGTPAPFVVLHVVGLGGVGKSALLAEFAVRAAAAGWRALAVDGHVVDPNPPAFEAGLGPIGEGPLVVLVDSYELLEPLDEWLREVFVPELPAGSLVVLAGRRPLSAGWTADPGWRGAVRVLELRNLARPDAVAYLADAGVPVGARATLAAATHGHPLALGLVVDVARQGRTTGAAMLDGADTVDGSGLLVDPGVLGVLVGRLVDEVPDDERRVALGAAVIGRFTTEDSLSAVLAADDVHGAFEWLRNLSCVHEGPRGLHPHDLAREVLDADMRWRDEPTYQQMRARVRAHIQHRIKTLRGPAQRDAIFDLFFTIRNDPPARRLWRWETLGAVVPEPVGEDDLEDVVALVARHEGAESAALARRWLVAQPDAFRIHRDRNGIAAVTAFLTLTEADADVAADPVTALMWQYVAERGPPAPGEEVLVNRFKIDRDVYQAASLAHDLVTVTHFQYVAGRPGLRWDFIVVADPQLGASLSRINFEPMPGPGPSVGGREYAVLVRDATRPNPVFDPIRPDPVPACLSPEQLAVSVRDALRNVARADVLARSPLVTLPAVVERGGGPGALRDVLQAAAERLRGHPRDEKLFRVLDRTYLRPAPTQERAAEALGLPMTTYRRHLTRATARMVQMVRDLDDAGGGPG